VKTSWLAKGTGPLSEVRGAVTSLLFLAGGLLIVWSSFIHFHLWQELGYRHIPTIGPLFLIQSIAGLILGLLTIAIRRAWTAILGLGFALMTMLGYLISVTYGLFGFKDAWSAPFAHQAFVLELLTIALLGIAGALCLTTKARLSQSSRHAADAI